MGRKGWTERYCLSKTENKTKQLSDPLETESEEEEMIKVCFTIWNLCLWSLEHANTISRYGGSCRVRTFVQKAGVFCSVDAEFEIPVDTVYYKFPICICEMNKSSHLQRILSKLGKIFIHFELSWIWTLPYKALIFTVIDLPTLDPCFYHQLSQRSDLVPNWETVLILSY